MMEKIQKKGIARLWVLFGIGHLAFFYLQSWNNEAVHIVMVLAFQNTVLWSILKKYIRHALLVGKC